MIFSRPCMWVKPFQIRASLSSYTLVPLHHVKEDFAQIVSRKTFRPNIFCNRTFSSVTRARTTSRNVSKADQLARSRPRLMKDFEAEMKKDNFSPEWELIFTSKAHNFKIVCVHWISLAGLAAVPFLLVWSYLQQEHEADVSIANLSYSKRTEHALFILVNAFMMTIFFKNARSIPRRIYFNERTENYLALRRSWLPWLTVPMQYKATNVRKLPFRILSSPLRFWKSNEFSVNNYRMIFIPSAFRSGQDRYHMLRYVES